mmetsp:Transcript_16572/g.24776  ORF Transcript_16572/g.24776 Transcript_16572/m.24776 type:complete len:386 (-) Transcript_16572:72-1229(-)
MVNSTISSPASAYQPLFSDGSGVSIISSLKRVHPFQWMCLVCGIYVASVHFKSSGDMMRSTRGGTPNFTYQVAGSASVTGRQPLTLAEFIQVNDRLLNAKVIENCDCGCLESPVKSCPRQYDLDDVQKSANVVITREIESFMDFALKERRISSQISCLGQDYSGIEHHTDSGGYCLNAFLKLAQDQGQDRGQVILPFPDRTIPVPKGHAPASQNMLDMLMPFVEEEKISSLSDFGAGLGQYGMALERAYPKTLIYRGYDGSGDVEVYTQGFLRFFDLSIPLNLPMSDWVMSLEVGEHIPNHLEGMVIRNLHAHNCRGILLSWGTPGQGGLNHINLHDNQYLIDIFTSLGYVHDVSVSEKFRSAMTTDGSWFATSLVVLRRKNPVC